MRMTALFVVALALCSSACPAPTDPSKLPALDLATFECGVQPLLDRDCSFPACHGNPGRAFFVYSASKTRSLGDQLRGIPLTDYELCANFLSASAFAEESPSQLVVKPLIQKDSSSQHHVGAYFFKQDSAEAECLRSFLAGEGWTAPANPTEAPAVCAMPWRIHNDGSYPNCTPRPLDCGSVIAVGPGDGTP